MCKGIHLKLNTILGKISEHFHGVVLALPLWVLKVWHTAWFSFLWTTYSWQLQDIYRQLYLLNSFFIFFFISSILFSFPYLLQTRDLYLPSWIENFLYSNPIQRGGTKQNIKFSCISILYTLRVMCSFFWWSKGAEKATGARNETCLIHFPRLICPTICQPMKMQHNHVTQKEILFFFTKTEKMIKSIEHFMLLKVILS